MEDLKQLVDWENGSISPRVYTDEDIHEAELDRLFGRTWLFVAHEDQIPNPGDYFSSLMGADPVIVIRQKGGSVKVLLNYCRHRGMKVCRSDRGNAKNFMCPYHGWTYDAGGSLISVPNFEDGYFGELDMAKWGLPEVAQVDSYRGFIFANFDASAPSLIDYLGDFAWYLDSVVDRHPNGTTVLGGVHKWRTIGNWKMSAEQFAGDSYHGGITHASAQIASLQMHLTEEEMALMALLVNDGRQYTSRLGHGMSFSRDMLLKTVHAFLGGGHLDTYFENEFPKMVKHLGEARSSAMLSNSTVFPNLGLAVSGPAMIRTWHPVSPNEFYTWGWVLVDKGMPPEAQEMLRTAQLRLQSPAGVAELDDLENWAVIGRNLHRGRQIRKLPLNFQMGLGHETYDDPDYPGRVGHHFAGDGPARSFYRRWMEFMTSEEWPKVDPAELHFAKQ